MNRSGESFRIHHTQTHIHVERNSLPGCSTSAVSFLSLRLLGTRATSRFTPFNSKWDPFGNLWNWLKSISIRWDLFYRAVLLVRVRVWITRVARPSSAIVPNQNGIYHVGVCGSYTSVMDWTSARRGGGTAGRREANDWCAPVVSVGRTSDLRWLISFDWMRLNELSLFSRQHQPSWDKWRIWITYHHSSSSIGSNASMPDELNFVFDET